jgi:hypothetical protein
MNTHQKLAKLARQRYDVLYGGWQPESDRNRWVVGYLDGAYAAYKTLGPLRKLLLWWRLRKV